MKNLMTFSLALTLLLSSISMAQYGTQPASGKSYAAMKSVSVTGTIGDDGKTFVSDKDGKSWTINNADAVKGHEGHHVTVKAHVSADTNAVDVVSLKMAGDNMKKQY